jgi:hypothetical protein
MEGGAGRRRQRDAERVSAEGTRLEHYVLLAVSEELR